MTIQQIAAGIVGIACTTCSVGAEVTIATDATFSPFHYVDEVGKVTGFDVELAKLRREFGLERDENWPINFDRQRERKMGSNRFYQAEYRGACLDRV